MEKEKMREHLQRGYIIDLEEAVVLLADLCLQHADCRETLYCKEERFTIAVARLNAAARAAQKKEGQSA